MPEIWLRANRRVLLLGMILPFVLVAIGLIPSLALGDRAEVWLRAVGWIACGIGLVLFVVIAAQLRSPRLAYADGNLLAYLRSGQPFRVPIESVECFFFGTSAGQIASPSGGDLPVRNLIIRIAEKAADWQSREFKPVLGRWADGYITIFGAWCEPLTFEVVQRLNANLARVQKELQAALGSNSANQNSAQR
ncbi:MAG TPA: hypothetical protein VGJ15_12830 [Pirellulales bacterium]|jgi:hypothetical protein